MTIENQAIREMVNAPPRIGHCPRCNRSVQMGLRKVKTPMVTEHQWLCMDCRWVIEVEMKGP